MLLSNVQQGNVGDASFCPNLRSVVPSPSYLDYSYFQFQAQLSSRVIRNAVVLHPVVQHPKVSFAAS